MNQLALPSNTLDVEDSAPTVQLPPLPGFKGMWVAGCLEYLEFAVFFSVYFVSRWFNPQAFQEGAARLWTLGGVCVTLVMVTSGYALTQALDAYRNNDVRRALKWQWTALLIGLCYPLIKVLEW